MILEFKKIDPLQRYKIMSQTVIPRPIAWIATEDKNCINIAPFSYFIPLSSKPPTLIVSIGHKKDGSQKDTLRNILNNKKCTISFVSTNLLNKMHCSSKELNSQISEAAICDIKMKKIFEDFPPMVEKSPSAFFCTLFQVVELKGSKTIPLILKIENYFLEDRFLKDKEKLHIDLDLIARVGKEYAICKDKIAPKEII